MDGQGTMQVASGAMLVAITASLAASVGYVAYSFDATPSATIVGRHDEFQDAWTALGRVSAGDVSWRASGPGVHFAVDEAVDANSPELSTQPVPMPVGREYRFCAAGDGAMEAWSFLMYSGDQLVGAVTFAAIMPC